MRSVDRRARCALRWSRSAKPCGAQALAAAVPADGRHPRRAPRRAVPRRAVPRRAALRCAVPSCVCLRRVCIGHRRPTAPLTALGRSINRSAQAHARTHAPVGMPRRAWSALASMRECALSAAMPSMNARVAARSCSRLWSRKRRSRSPCASTRCASARSAAQRALPSRSVPHLYQDRAHSCGHIGTGTGQPIWPSDRAGACILRRGGQTRCAAVAAEACAGGLFVCLFVRSFYCSFHSSFGLVGLVLFSAFLFGLSAAAQVGALQMIGLTPVRVLEALQARPRAASIGRAYACAHNGLSSVWRAPRSLTPTPAAAGVCRGDGRAAAPGSVHRTGDVGLGRSGEVGDVCEGLSGKAAKQESAKRDSDQAGKR
jgi:hypothetical protein